MNNNNFIIVIAGPTATGKTELSVKLAEQINAEIISADSRQIYRNFDIGTAKPSKELLNRIPHHFIDVADITENFTAFDFRNKGLETIDDLFKKNKNAVIAGGSGLYIQSLICNDMVNAYSDESVRNQLSEKIKKYGSVRLYEELKRVDPVYARKIHYNDRIRIIRALEVYNLTGKPFTETVKKTGFPYTAYCYCLYAKREKMYENINNRIDRMVKENFINEVEKLIGLGFKTIIKEKKIIGYSEIIDYIEGKTNFKRAVDDFKKNTRHYAKRQMTWFKKDKMYKWFDVEKYSSAGELICEILTDIYAQRMDRINKELI